MLNRRTFLLAAAVVPVGATRAFADAPCVFAQQGFAIHGMDPVSYFTETAPVAGLDRHLLRWRHAIWRFSSPTTMEAFERDPHRYAPQYGGFCAVSMAEGSVSETVPEAWVMHEGQLYFARSRAAIARWQRNPALFITGADSHWSASVCS